MERILILLSLLVAVQTAWARDPISDEKLTQIVDQFQYITIYNIKDNNTNSGSWDTCWYYTTNLETDYPGATGNYEIKTKFYIPNRDDLGTDQVPFVILLPPMGGANFLDESMAETLCSRNIAAMIITNDFTGVQNGDVPPVEDHDMAFHRTVAGVKAAMAFAKDDPNVNGDKVGLFGVSLGGILGSFAMSTQLDISAGYFVVAGGDVPHILAYSDNEQVARIRVERMKLEGFTTKDEYEDYLRVNMSLDPFDLSRSVPSETISMVLSRNDTTVPTEDQLLLHTGYGQPKVQYTNSGHVDAVIETLLWGDSRRKIADFFKERFKLENPRLSTRWLEQFDLSRY